MVRGENIVLWPVYFDSTKTIKEGRRISRKNGKRYPTISMIESALQSKGYSFTCFPKATHPRLPWKVTGKILVAKNKAKTKIIKEIASTIQELPV